MPALFGSDPLLQSLALADLWAGGALALIVGGSHASGEAVWAEAEGRRLSLSDLDVYAIVPDRTAQRMAIRRMRADQAGLRARLLSWGMAAPLEVAFLVPRDLGRLAARPATLELKRRGRVAKGDASWLGRVPDWRPADVSEEEIRLLLENRAFDLLACRPDGSVGLAALQARHAWLKCALDLVRVEALFDGAWIGEAASLPAWSGRSGRPLLPALAAPRFRSLLDTALAWRSGRVDAIDPAAARCEWQAVVEAWAAVWRERVGPSLADALRSARRAPLRRRLRCALLWPARSGRGPSPASRLLHALRGTPQHRVNAAAAILLLRAAGAEGGETAIPRDARRALAALGVVEPQALADWSRAARAVVCAWDRWVLDGQRTAEPA